MVINCFPFDGHGALYVEFSTEFPVIWVRFKDKFTQNRPWNKSQLLPYLAPTYKSLDELKTPS